MYTDFEFVHSPFSCRQTVIHYCAAQNFVEFLHDLADLGAAIDLADTRGLTPLHMAAGAGRTSAVSALLGRGADANVSAPNGDTPIHLACQHGHAAAVSAYIVDTCCIMRGWVTRYCLLKATCRCATIASSTIIIARIIVQLRTLAQLLCVYVILFHCAVLQVGVHTYVYTGCMKTSLCLC